MYIIMGNGLTEINKEYIKENVPAEGDTFEEYF